MGFNILDLAVLAYVGFGAWRGFRNGFAKEVPRVVGWLVFTITGYGLFRWLARGLHSASQMTGYTVGIVGIVGVIVGAWLLSGLIRRRMSEHAAQSVADDGKQRTLGMITGGVRTLVIACFVIVYLGLLPIGVLNRPFANGSFFGRTLIRFVVPVYETVAGEEPRPKSAEADKPKSPPAQKRPAYNPSSRQF